MVKREQISYRIEVRRNVKCETSNVKRKWLNVKVNIPNANNDKPEGFMQRLIFLFIILISTIHFVEAAEHYDFIVAQNGSGNFTTLQAAIDAVPSGLTRPFKIFIKNGRYKERVRIPVSKP